MDTKKYAEDVLRTFDSANKIDYDWEQTREERERIIAAGVREQPDLSRENRIEALRAASRITAGQGFNGAGGDATTLFLAKQFAKYLEGE